MKKITIFSTWIVLTASGLFSVFAQGVLAPAGAPGATMKTLSQIEPRTLIDSVPYIITNSGSYYLATNLSSLTHGVIIRSDRVTLDLAGFLLSGDRGTDDYGVWLDGEAGSSVRDIQIKGGIIRGFGRGIMAENTRNSQIEDMMISGNSKYGVHLSGQCEGNIITACSARSNDTAGVYLDGSSSGRCYGTILSDCAASDNPGYGIYLNGYQGQCDGNLIHRCTVNGNRLNYGIFLRGQFGLCNGNAITECMISSNKYEGLSLYGNSGQCNGNLIADCSVIRNGTVGIKLNGQSGQCNGNSISGCTIAGSGDNGLFMDGSSGGECDGNAVTECVLYANTSYGLYVYYADANRIEGNQVSSTIGAMAYGIYVGTSSNNLVVQNSCMNQTNNIFCITNAMAGPVVANKGVLATTNGAAALSPWANFSR